MKILLLEEDMLLKEGVQGIFIVDMKRVCLPISLTVHTIAQVGE